MAQWSVLIVDSDPVGAEELRRHVGQVPGLVVCGYATEGAQALAMAATSPVDLVILDVLIPDMPGLDMLDRLRRDQANLDALVVTACREPAQVERAIRLGALDYIVRPYTPERLIQSLRRYVQLRRALSAGGAVTQRAIDLWHRTPYPAQPAPRGIEPATLRRITAYLSRCQEPKSAQEIADATGFSRVTCLRYLTHLSNQGLAEVELSYGPVGRPTKLYRWRGETAVAATGA